MPVSRREFDQLARRFEIMDESGTRGVGALQQMVVDLAGKFSDLRAEFTAHEVRHEKDREDRERARRWAVGTAISFGLLLVAIISILITMVGHGGHLYSHQAFYGGRQCLR